jgi:hypothetical protein
MLGWLGFPPPPTRRCSSFPLSEKDNGFSLSQHWPVSFDPSGELVVWEKDAEFLEGLPLDWVIDGGYGEESLAILDASEEVWDKMIARQKTKGKRELLNLKSFINYGEMRAPSRRGKGKAHITYGCVPLGVLRC